MSLKWSRAVLAVAVSHGKPEVVGQSWSGLLRLNAHAYACRKYLEEEVDVEQPERPIYLLGESFGAVLALAVAHAKPDLVDRLVLVNPATSYEKSIWPRIGPLLSQVPDVSSPNQEAPCSKVPAIGLKGVVQCLVLSLCSKPGVAHLCCECLPLICKKMLVDCCIQTGDFPLVLLGGPPLPNCVSPT